MISVSLFFSWKIDSDHDLDFEIYVSLFLCLFVIVGVFTDFTSDRLRIGTVV